MQALIPTRMRSRVAKAWPYIVTVEPSTTPLTLAETKSYLKDPPDADDILVTCLIETVTEYAELYMKRDLITRTYKTFRDDFSDCLELRRSPSQSVTSVKYFLDSVLTTVSTDIYFLTQETAFSKLALKLNQVWPTDEDNIEQAVEIIFKSGFGDTETTIPEDIRTALLQHVAALYENRGDCSCDFADTNATQKLLPLGARLIYDMRKIRDIRSL